MISILFHNCILQNVTSSFRFLSSTRNFSDSAHQSNVFDVQSVEEFQGISLASNLFIYIFLKMSSHVQKRIFPLFMSVNALWA